MEQQHREEGGKEEVWLSAFSALPHAGTSAKQVEATLDSTFAPRYGPDGALRGASQLECMGGRHVERSRSRGGSDPEYALRGSSTNPSSVMSNGIHNSNVMVGARGTNSSLFSSTATNSASDAGRKRKSPDRPTDRATAAHMQQQHARQTPSECYSRSVLGSTSASYVQPNPDTAIGAHSGMSVPASAAIGASIMGPAIVDPHILVPEVREVRVTPCDVPAQVGGVRNESESNGREGDAHDECGTDDEWLPRCQGIWSGSAPNQRIKSRTMVERGRRERISEGLQRLRAKVRGRGDTCAMLDRSVGYVDALERRVEELERVVMVTAGSGRNVFPGNAFAGGGAFASRGFAGNVFVNNAAQLASLLAALTSVPARLGGEPWLDTTLV
ncbi:unnamed protein product [Closterium sp. NIES-64]|nr:unnamed protein product [Closterium sp. NIES-64]